MSDEKNFFARWSRRKHGANPETTEQSKPENCGDVLVSKLPTASLSQASSFDAASLPAIDSIGPGSDIRSFLEVGVPADLTRAALRRVWLTDPAIRDFVGLSENSWDFNAPGAIPGFGSIDAESVANMVTRLLGGPDAIATQKDALLKVPYANEDSLRAGAPVEDIPTDSPSGIQNLSQVRLAEPSAVDAHEVTPQAEATTAGNAGSCERTGSKSRRTHGGALPELP
jgi:hypothetical protein